MDQSISLHVSGARDYRSRLATQPGGTMKVAPYLFLDGRAEEAIEYYRRVLGAEVGRMVRFKDNPDPKPGMTPPGAENKIMHAALRIGDTALLISDGRCAGKPEFRGFSLSLSVADDAEAESKFTALSDGGQVQFPLAKTFFSSSFGMVMDRFGIMWMVVVER
jgi:PhnB protein